MSTLFIWATLPITNLKSSAGCLQFIFRPASNLIFFLCATIYFIVFYQFTNDNSLLCWLCSLLAWVPWHWQRGLSVNMTWSGWCTAASIPRGKPSPLRTGISLKQPTFETQKSVMSLMYICPADVLIFFSPSQQNCLFSLASNPSIGDEKDLLRWSDHIPNPLFSRLLPQPGRPESFFGSLLFFLLQWMNDNLSIVMKHAGNLPQNILWITDMSRVALCTCIYLEWHVHRDRQTEHVRAAQITLVILCVLTVSNIEHYKYTQWISAGLGLIAYLKIHLCYWDSV